MPAYIYRPDVTFEATNVVGNVYFANFVRWQGACRERFLKAHAPGVLKLVAQRALVLHTSSVDCKFTDPIGATLDDEISVEMRLTHLRGGRLTVAFDYFRVGANGQEQAPEQIAAGTQSLCCKRPTSTGLVPAVFPAELLLALRKFADSPKLQASIDEAIEFSSEGVTPVESEACASVVEVE
jgi:enediyne biosynthesis thioesterase